MKPAFATRRFRAGFPAALLVSLSIASIPARAAPPERPTYNRDVRPILAENCFACHGPDRNARKGKFRLDERASALRKGAIVPGRPEKSELVARIFSGEPREIMPPPKTKKRLTAEQKETLRRWVAQGAAYEAHWAYVPLRRPAVPSVKGAAWVRNPLDAFLLQALEVRHVRPSPEADRRTLIRRLSLDLTGLPPTPGEVRAFLADNGPKAYEKVVDRLLASRHYGERMAVPWLDAVRYADTVGYHGDQPQRIFPYRDYVIESFNRNKPFDQFTLEQLAGDLLPPSPGGGADRLVATGFNRLTMMTREGGAQPKEYLARYAADRVRTVGTAWLGSTLGCCECHDHKFDPFTTKDFYQLEAFFADVKQWGVYQDYPYTPNPDLRGWSNDHPFPPEILVESPALVRRLERVRRQMDELYRAASRPATAAAREAFARWCEASRDFLRRAPEGWQHLAPEGKAHLATDGRVTLDAPGPGPVRLQARLPAGWLASLRVEIFPDARLGNRVAGGSGGTVRLAAALGGKPLEFRQAEADRKEPTYRAGEEVPGIGSGWRLAGRELDKTHRGYWLLRLPARVAAGDVLTVTLGGAAVGSVRVSFSPFASEDPLRTVGGSSPEWKALRGALAAPDGAGHEAVLYGAYLRGTGWEAAAYRRYLDLYARWLECTGGKAWTMITQAAASPLTVRVLRRGNWQDESGPVIRPTLPHFLPGPSGAGGRRLTRLDLARWLVSPENPLTARAVVNRFWAQFFGKGLSARLDDLGGQGEWPSHPELLDWLAVEFRESGWDVKHVVRLLVTSAAYRQSSNLRPELRELDPGNRLLAFQNPRRLEAEFVRDNALAVAGLLNREYGGPAAWPYQPAGYYANLQFPDRDYVPDRDGRQYRRGVYVHWQRTFLHPMLANFDAPTREDCTAGRNVANTPQQALTLLNDPTFVEAARAFAARVLAGPGRSDAERIQGAFELALARPARAAEQESLLRFLAGQREHFRANPDGARKLLAVGLAPVPRDGPGPELAAWTQVCRAILNLHETITRY
jgi:hypothetical protein